MENIEEEIETVIAKSKRKNEPVKLSEKKIKENIDKLNLHINSIFEQINIIKQNYTQEEDLKNSTKTTENLKKNTEKTLIVYLKDLLEPLQTLISFNKFLTGFYLSLKTKAIKELTSRMDVTSKDILFKIENILIWLIYLSNDIKYNIKTINIKELILANLIYFEGALKRKNLRIRNNLSNDVFVKSDMEIINYVIKNLISNAIKYSFSNSDILIQIKQQTSTIELLIKDKGMGMDKEELSAILCSNIKTSKLGTYQEKGLGIGLLPFREFIKKNHGNIIIKSAPEKGTTIGFTLPLIQNKIFENEPEKK